MPDSQPKSGTQPAVVRTAGEPFPTNQYSLLAWLAKLLTGLSTQQALIMFVCAILGVLEWKMLDQFQDWQARTDRMNAERIESDRRAYETDKVLIRADGIALAKAQQESFRLMQKDLIGFWSTEGEKNRMVIVEAVKVEVARLAGKHEAEECPTVAPAPKVKGFAPQGSP